MRNPYAGSEYEQYLCSLLTHECSGENCADCRILGEILQFINKNIFCSVVYQNTLELEKPFPG